MSFIADLDSILHEEGACACMLTGNHRQTHLHMRDIIEEMPSRRHRELKSDIYATARITYRVLLPLMES